MTQVTQSNSYLMDIIRKDNTVYCFKVLYMFSVDDWDIMSVVMESGGNFQLKVAHLVA